MASIEPIRRALSTDFFDGPSPEVARRLIGVRLAVDGVGGTIVETEAYEESDPASHSFRGPTTRNAVMFGPPGRAYVYFSYGVHWCLNFVCGPEGSGRAVLIRALAPEFGIGAMQARRGTDELRRLCAGPGRLCQALGIGRGHSGMRLDAPPFQLDLAAARRSILVGPRIGISKAVEKPWRFGLAGSPFVSRPFRAATAEPPRAAKEG